MHNTLFVVKDQLFARKRHLSPFLPQQSKKLITPRSATAADLGAIKKGERNNEKALIGSIFRPLGPVSLIDLIITDPTMKINTPSYIIHAQSSPILKKSYLLNSLSGKEPQSPWTIDPGALEKREGGETMTSIDW